MTREVKEACNIMLVKARGKARQGEARLSIAIEHTSRESKYEYCKVDSREFVLEDLGGEM